MRTKRNLMAVAAALTQKTSRAKIVVLANLLPLHGNPLRVAEERDPKGLYKKARAGEIPEFTGVSDPYEAPLAPEVVVPTHDRTVAESAALVLEYLDSVGLSAP